MYHYEQIKGDKMNVKDFKFEFEAGYEKLYDSKGVCVISKPNGIVSITLNLEADFFLNSKDPSDQGDKNIKNMIVKLVGCIKSRMAKE